MQPTTAILDRIMRNSRKNNEDISRASLILELITPTSTWWSILSKHPLMSPSMNHDTPVNSFFRDFRAMQPTTAILDRIMRNSRKNNEEIFTRLYRYMLRPDLYYLAYNKLYRNKGAATKGVDDDTADGFSEEKINRIIQSLADDLSACKTPLQPFPQTCQAHSGIYWRAAAI